MSRIDSLFRWQSSSTSQKCNDRVNRTSLDGCASNTKQGSALNTFSIYVRSFRLPFLSLVSRLHYPWLIKHAKKVHFIIIIIIMLPKGYACFLFLNPHDEFGPSISSSVVLCSFVLLVYIVVLVLVVCLCPSSVHVVATFFWYCFYFLYYVLCSRFFP